MANKFIELDRSFASISKDHSFNEEESTFYFALGIQEKKKWGDLLQLRRVVILAEAGAGKTAEIRAATNQLRDSGKKAFFLRLEHLCSGFEIAFEMGSHFEFAEWLRSDEPAWFFLDSVDEARLRGPKQFEEAIRRFSVKLGDHRQRAYVYITSRFSEWRPQSDLLLIKDQLPCFELPSTSEEEQEECESVSADGTASATTTPNTKSEQKPVEPAIFALCSLDTEQIKIFSEAYDVQNLDVFMTAIQKAEAEIFSERPEDLIDLINFWNQHEKFGNHSVMIEASIDSKLKERDPDRDQQLPLSHEEALYGSERLAAATTFMRKTRILIPDSNPDPKLKAEAINVQSVLPSWDSNKIGALLQRPIFDEAIYGAVRFHHRSVREFLTAKWLLRLLSKGKSRRAIEKLFFEKRYGRTVLLPSMRPILAWLILVDDLIRERTQEIAPEIFIQGGDPSALPKDIRKNLLVKMCSCHAEQNTTKFSFDISELKRFAHPDLAETINRLLGKYSGEEEIRQLLLRIIWQGEIKACSEKALEFALNGENDIYTRINGVRAIGAVGSGEQKERLFGAITSNTNCKDEKLIGALLQNIAPIKPDVQDVLALIQRVEKPDRYSTSWLDEALKDYSLYDCPKKEVLDWIRGLLALLKQPPVIERRQFEVSKKFGWLLPYASMSAERLVRLRHPNAFEKSVLETIQLEPVGHHYDNYYRKEKLALEKLVPEWSELNRVLFWFNVESARSKQLEEKNGDRLTAWCQVHPIGAYWKFNESDFEEMLKDVNDKSFLDDRLVALSMALNIYINNGRGRTRLRKLKKVVKGVPELEKELHRCLHPSPMTDERKRFQRANADFNRRQKRRKEKNAKFHQKSREWLKIKYEVLRDTSVAKDGNVWSATNYLIDRLRDKKDNSDKWAISNWEDLVPEFGDDVAEAYRDGCTDYWREYRPKIRSEGLDNPNSIPMAVIVGLSGLQMEARHVLNWPSNLSEEEAALACRYAFHELTGFPSWLQKLHAVFPEIVEASILKEIEWEFVYYKNEGNCNYVLSDVVWHLGFLKPEISSKVIRFLKDYEPQNDNTVRSALEIILAVPGLDRNVFAETARTKVSSNISQSRKVLWLAAWMGVEAKGAIKTLNLMLKAIAEPEEATACAMEFAGALLGERHDKAIKSEYKDFQKVDELLSLYKLMLKYIRPSEDIDRTREGAYSPGPRDHAQSARDRLYELLRKIPGKATYLALKELALNDPDSRARYWYEVDAKGRAEKDAEFDPWKPEGIATFAEEAEKAPQNHRELYDLTVSRLFDLKADLENGDNSQAEVYKDEKQEVRHRNFIGGWLRERSLGRYNVPQEEELADAKKPDIRIHGVGFDGPVPIELKIADNKWSGNQLVERLSNQLCGQYLRDTCSNCGIFLLVYRGQKKYWKHPETGEKLDFQQLIQLLEGEAKEIITGQNKIESIEVIGIDLTKRTNPTSLTNG